MSTPGPLKIGEDVTLSGNVTTLVAGGASAPSYGTTFQVEFLDALTDPNNSIPHILQGQDLDTSSSACTSSACPFTEQNVRIDTSTTNGLWTLTYSFPVADMSNWTVVATQVATPAQMAAAVTADKPITGLLAYALPTATLQKFASAAGLNAAGDGNSILGRGAVIGLVQSANVSVTVQNSNFTVYYPNDRFTSLNASATGASGMFLVVGPAVTGSPDAAPAESSSVSFTAAAGNANTWAAATLQMQAGMIVVQPFAPQ